MTFHNKLERLSLAVRPIQPSLMFAGKTEAYLSEAPGAPLLGRLLALPTNSRPDLKGLPATKVSLFWKVVTYGCKEFYNIDPRWRHFVICYLFWQQCAGGEERIHALPISNKKKIDRHYDSNCDLSFLDVPAFYRTRNGRKNKSKNWGISTHLFHILTIEKGLEQAPFFLIWTCKKPADYGPQQH